MTTPFYPVPVSVALCAALALRTFPSAAQDAQGLALGAQTPILQAAGHRALDLGDEVSLEAWVQAGAMARGGGRILDKSIPGTDEGFVLDTYPANSLRMTTRNGAVNFDARLPADKWTHVVGVYSASRKIHKL